jgi:phytoene dehydrogenase-like protein
MIARFFRPYFGGNFFEEDLQTSSRMFDFVFRMFSLGQTAIPASGMQAIPRQIAASLPEDTVRLNARVANIDHNTVTLENGETLTAPVVIIATEAPVMHTLLRDDQKPDSRSTTCLYYTADELPMDDPMLILNGDGTGPINNVNLLSNVAPSYAPAGKALVSATVVGNPDVADGKLESQVRRHLAEWFGPEVGTWEHLCTYRVPYALPDQSPPFLSEHMRSPRHRPGLYLCGDHCATASINGALLSGRLAAEAVLQDLAAG